MQKKEKIRILLPVHLYHLTVIRLSNLEKSSQYVHEHIKLIEQMETHQVMVPSIYELNHSTEDYIYKYGEIMKDFIGHTKKKYLITNNLVLDALIKENKIESMLRFFYKKNKNILIFTKNDDLLKHVPKEIKGYKFRHYELNTWQDEFKIFELLTIIKEDTYSAYEVFKYNYWANPNH